ncbi:helix-turn-helix domain-containing protein [Ensifer adhaerens]
MNKPFTPKSLADRWGCSDRHIRNMIARGELTAYRLGGKLLRIQPQEVERVETCNNGDLPASQASFASHGMTPAASADVIALEPLTRKRRTASPRLDTRN